MKKSKIQIIYPKSQLSKGVDEDYQEEVDAMLKYSPNMNIALFDDVEFKLINHNEGIAFFRGWMFNESDYTKFFNLCKESGVTLITAPESYMNFHHLPSWYDAIRELTPKTVIVDDLDKLDETINSLNWDKYFIKDYVKSLNTDGGAIANSLEEIKSMLTKMEMYRGEIEGGLCIRKVEDFDVDSECRFFVLNGSIVGNNGFVDPIIKVPDIVYDCIEILKNKSRFFTIDTVKTKSGDYRIVEVGDGQVSGLKDLNIELFCEEFLEEYGYSIIGKYSVLRRANILWEAIKPEHYSYITEIHNGISPLRRVEVGLCVPSDDLHVVKEMIEHYMPVKIVAGSSEVFDDSSIIKCTHINPYWQGNTFLTLVAYPSFSQKSSK